MPLTNTTLSHHFIASLDPQRDRLWAMATGAAASGEAAPGQPAATTLKTEGLLQAAIRDAFEAVEKDHDADPWGAVEQALAARGITAAPVSPSPSAETPATPPPAMPADVWARLVATVQVQAARSAHTRAINPDSVLLSPDPLLAPKKIAAPDDGEGFDLSPSSRFVLAAGIAVVVGIGLTIYLLTRPGAPPSPSTQQTSTTHPVTAPAH